MSYIRDVKAGCVQFLLAERELIRLKFYTKTKNRYTNLELPRPEKRPGPVDELT